MVAIQRSLDESVQRTLRLIFLLMGGTLLAAFAAALGYGQYLVSRLDTVFEDRVVPLHDLQVISSAVNVRIPQNFWSGDYEAGARAAAGVSPLERDWAEVETIWGRYMLTYLTPRETVLAASVRESLDDLRRGLLPEGARPDARRAFGIDTLGYAGSVRLFNERMGALEALQVDVAKQHLIEARTASYWAAVLGFLMVGVLLVLAVFAQRVVAHRVVAPVQWVSRSLQRLADGDTGRQPPGFGLSSEFSDLVEQMDSVRRFVAERQRLLVEEQQISQRLREAQAELVEAEKLASLGGLVAGVAHELNTPIGVAVTVSSSLEDKRRQFSDVLGGGGLKRSVLDTFVRDVQQAGGLLLQNLERAATLVRSFKQVAVDRASMQRRNFDLGQTVEELLVSLRPSLRGKRVALQSDAPAGVLMDSYPGAVGQVVTNLMNNAVMHAFHEDDPEPEGGRWIRIEVRPTASGPVSLKVSDNGRGMAPETLARVYEPFFTTRMGQGGTGLGMSIVRNIVVGLLGGRMQVQSEPGQGTVVEVLVPHQAPNRDVQTSQEALIYAVR